MFFILKKHQVLIFRSVFLFISCSMATLFPLLFQKNKRSVPEQQRYNLLEKAKFGIFCEDFANIHGKKSYLTFLKEGNQHTSWYHEIPVFHMFDDWWNSREAYLTESKLDECRNHFEQLTKCLHYTALAEDIDPLTIYNRLYFENKDVQKVCYQPEIQSRQICGGSRYRRFMKIHNYELTISRWRRNFYQYTGDLREDLGFQRYPDTFFSLEELKEIKRQQERQKTVLDKITNFDFSYDFSMSAARNYLSELIDLNRSYIAELYPLDERGKKEKMWDARKNPNDKQKRYVDRQFTYGIRDDTVLRNHVMPDRDSYGNIIVRGEEEDTSEDAFRVKGVYGRELTDGTIMKEDKGTFVERPNYQMGRTKEYFDWPILGRYTFGYDQKNYDNSMRKNPGEHHRWGDENYWKEVNEKYWRKGNLYNFQNAPSDPRASKNNENLQK